MNNKRVKNSNYQKEYRRIMKLELFNLLGRKCVRCGYEDIRALQFDHIIGGGRKDKRELKGNLSMVSFYRKNPEKAKQTLQVLCANCNWIKRHENGEHGGRKRVEK